MTPKTDPRVYIIILNWNGLEDTIECLDSLKDLKYSNFDVIVVDNASTDNSVREIRKKYPGVIILESDKNLGYAGGNNLGLKYALNRNADFVWLLNNDTVVREDALSHLIKKMTENTSIGICGSRLIYYHNPDTIQALGGGRYNRCLGVTTHVGSDESADLKWEEREIEQKLDYIVGASMMVSRNFIEEVGLLSEDYFLYYEELDWATRGKEKFNLGFASDSIVYHKEGASTQGNNQQLNSKSRLSDYYQIKNRIKFTLKFYPYKLPFVYLSLFVSLINRGRRGQWDRIPMILKLLFTFNR